MALFMLSAMAQNSPYIVKTKGAKRSAKSQSNDGRDGSPTDFMGKNFRYYSMCDWREGMRFMVVPEKVDLLVNTFHDAETKQMVGNGYLRHNIFIYSGHEEISSGRVHVMFTCEEDGKHYYYELPYGTFEDYCYTRKGIPTLAYLGDVDRARELLIGEQMLTRADHYRVDTEYDGDGYKVVEVDKNEIVTVKAVGVGTRAFPVKIIVEDNKGNQFYQCVAISKTNSGLGDDEFILENERHLFQNSFEYGGATMTVSDNIGDYLGSTIHTNHPVIMTSRGSGKMREVRVPRFTGFILDEITPIQNSRYYTLTLRETESRRIYTKEVVFDEADIDRDGKGSVENDFFGYIFGMGDGALKETNKEIRAAIREGRVIRGMSKEQVELTMGVPDIVGKDKNGDEMWSYYRSEGTILLDAIFDSKTGLVDRGAKRDTELGLRKKAEAAKKKQKQKPATKQKAREITLPVDGSHASPENLMNATPVM